MTTQGLPPNAQPMKSTSDIAAGDRLFYELGHYQGKRWVREGVFKEIREVENMIQMDTMINDPEYIAHHNFVIVKSNQ